jgi:hypothetical protein
MASRKVAAAAVEELPRDDIADVFRDDEPPAEEPILLGRVCLWCGGEGSAYEGCDHRELARFSGASRTAHEAVMRLRRAAAEHRAAARALRALVLTEVSRDRAELESRPPPAPLPCSRCAARDAAAAAEAPAVEAPTPAPPRAKKRAKGTETQQAFDFAGERDRA